MTVAEDASAQAPGSRIPLGRAVVKLNPLHGRIVSALKVILPTVALSLIILAVAWPMLEERDRDFALGLIGDILQKPQAMQILNARYSGFEGENQPFSITADAVDQDTPDAPVAQLTQPKADILLKDGSWMAITAPEGTVHKPDQTLQLEGGVNLFHDQGYEFRTDRALLNFKEGSAKGDDPVEGQGPFGTIKADGFRIYDRGDRVVLKGKAKVTIFPDAKVE